MRHKSIVSTIIALIMSIMIIHVYIYVYTYVYVNLYITELPDLASRFSDPILDSCTYVLYATLRQVAAILPTASSQTFFPNSAGYSLSLGRTGNCCATSPS